MHWFSILKKTFQNEKKFLFRFVPEIKVEKRDDVKESFILKIKFKNLLLSVVIVVFNPLI
jgi:hypothetical protein